MAVNIIYGRAASGKSHMCIEQIAEAVKRGNRDGSVILIVPEQFSYSAERRLASALGAVGGASAEVLTFSRLAHRVFSAPCKTLSPAGKNMLVYKALYKQKNHLGIFAGSGDKPGMVDKIAALISEFKRYGISTEQLSEQANRSQNELLRQKLCDLSVVYACYDELMLNDYIDSEDNLYLAASMLSSGGMLRGAHIWIDEFSDFLPQHYAMLEAIAQTAESITISLCCDRERDTEGFFAPAAKTIAELQRLCIRSNTELTTCYIGDEKNYITSTELRHLESAYTNYRTPKYSGKTCDIRLFEANNTFSEIEHCARQVLALVRDGGYRYRDITVAVSNMDTYAAYTQAVFEQSGIACFVSEKPAASTHPLVLMLGAVFNIFIKNWSYDSVFAYLKSGYSGVDARDIDRLENYVLAAGIRGNRWYQAENWRYRVNVFDDAEQDTAYLDEMDAIRRHVVEPLTALREGIGGRKTVRESCRAVYEFMCGMGLFEQTQRMVEQLKEQGALSLANQYSRVWNVIIQILDQMVLIAGDDKMGMEALRNLMMTGFSKHQSGIIPQSVDRVTVCDIPNSRACDSKVLLILGANSEAFPSVSAKEGILTDADRTMLSEADIALAPTTRQQAMDERFLAYKALTKPSERLYISYAMANAEGAALIPSPVVGTLRKIFPQMTIEDDLCDKADSSGDIELVSSRTDTFNKLCAHLPQARYGGLWADVLAWYSSNAVFARRCDAVRDAAAYSAEAEPIPISTLERLYPGDIYSSVSRLEAFRQCPYAYFVKFTLKAKERKILQMGAPDIGTLLHTVMERFTERVVLSGNGWRGIDSDWCKESASEIVDELMAQMFSNSTLAGGNTAFLIQRLKDNLIQYIQVMTEHIRRGEFEPVGSEVPFGDGEHIRYEVSLGGKKLKLSGRIDRIDALETENGTYYRVIDYKSGSKRFSLENVYHNLDLQLMVYLDAAVSQTQDGKRAGMLYYRITEPSIRLDGPLIASSADEEGMELELKSKLKMDGLVLSEIAILERMDSKLGENPKMLPVEIVKSGGFGKRSSAASLKQFELLSDYIKDSLKRIGKEIVGGRIDIMPYKQKKKRACDYCAFGGICKYESASDNCDNLRKIGNDDIWAKLMEQYAIEGGAADGI